MALRHKPLPWALSALSGQGTVVVPTYKVVCGDAPLALAALAVALAVESSLRIVPLPKLCGVLGIKLKPDPVLRPGLGFTQSAHALRVAHAVRRAYTRAPIPDSCLRRCLCAGFLLRNYDPRLVLGVRKSGDFQAHAWLDLRGTVLDWNALHDEFSPLT